MNTDIYTINPDGSGKFRVTNTKKTPEGRADYSPDGKKIAYVGWDRNYASSEIYTINATGGKPFQVTNNKTRDSDPSFSPDGKKIAYDTYYSNSPGIPTTRIYTISVRGGGKSKFVTEGVCPSWGSRP